MTELEKGFHWLDEAIYLGKKFLVHCRYSIGRTGTFVTAYLLRRGLGMKLADKVQQHSKTAPANYSQWRFLKKYGKKSGRLTIREPRLEHRNVVDLGVFFVEYEGMVAEMERLIAASPAGQSSRYGIDNAGGCRRYFELRLIEAIYLSNRMNRTLTSGSREEIIEGAVGNSRVIRRLAQSPQVASAEDLQKRYLLEDLPCPLLRENRCQLAQYRPLSCRLYGLDGTTGDLPDSGEILASLSRSVFLALSGVLPDESLFRPCLADVVSGRFIQTYFHYLRTLGSTR